MATISETGAVSGKEITVDQYFSTYGQLQQQVENGEIDHDQFNDSNDKLNYSVENANASKAKLTNLGQSASGKSSKEKS